MSKKGKELWILNILFIGIAFMTVMLGNSISEREKVSADTLKFQAPVIGNVTMTSPYGWRTINGVADFHNGIDLDEASKPIKLYAMADGVVTASTEGCPVGSYGDPCGGTMGNNVQVQTGEYSAQGKTGKLGYVYMHLLAGSVKVKEGDKVKMGQELGTMGGSGSSIGEHLHISIWISESPTYDHGNLVDPVQILTMLPKQEGETKTTNGEVFESTGGGGEAKKEEDEKNKAETEGKRNPFNPFRDVRSQMNPLGLSNRQTDYSSGTITKIRLQIFGMEDTILKLMFIASYILMGILSILLVIYLTFPLMGDKGGGVADKIFGALTERDAINNPDNTKKFIGVYFVTMVVLMLVLTQEYTVIMSLIYEMGGKFYDIIQSLSGGNING